MGGVVGMGRNGEYLIWLKPSLASEQETVNREVSLSHFRNLARTIPTTHNKQTICATIGMAIRMLPAALAPNRYAAGLDAHKTGGVFVVGLEDLDLWYHKRHAASGDHRVKKLIYHRQDLSGWQRLGNCRDQQH